MDFDFYSPVVVDDKLALRWPYMEGKLSCWGAQPSSIHPSIPQTTPSLLCPALSEAVGAESEGGTACTQCMLLKKHPLPVPTRGEFFFVCVCVQSPLYKNKNNLSSWRTEFEKEPKNKTPFWASCQITGGFIFKWLKVCSGIFSCVSGSCLFFKEEVRFIMFFFFLMSFVYACVY